MRSGTIRPMPLALVVVLAAASALLPGTGMATPPESDGSTYTWAGAAVLTVDIKPWGGGYVRSDPYLIDCPGTVRSSSPPIPLPGTPSRPGKAPAPVRGIPARSS